jgi:hypothetical protein
MKRYQTSRFDSEKTILSATLILEWDELDYGSRCCLGDLAGFRASFVEETLARQNAAQVEKWIKCMLYWCLQDRSRGKAELRFTAAAIKFVKRRQSFAKLRFELMEEL